MFIRKKKHNRLMQAKEEKIQNQGSTISRQKKTIKSLEQGIDGFKNGYAWLNQTKEVRSKRDISYDITVYDIVIHTVGYDQIPYSGIILINSAEDFKQIYQFNEDKFLDRYEHSNLYSFSTSNVSLVKEVSNLVEEIKDMKIQRIEYKREYDITVEIENEKTRSIYYKDMIKMLADGNLDDEEKDKYLEILLSANNV